MTDVYPYFRLECVALACSLTTHSTLSWRGTSGIMLVKGIEHPAYALRVRCSTPELHQQMKLSQ